ncbi:hypothetical protein DV736_g5716, partial [Chaetothyriales sp. CBS 134916]
MGKLTASPCNGYGSRFLSIKVGQQSEPFNIHEDRLRKTAFFDRHGEPAGKVVPKREGPVTTALATLDGPVLSRTESKDTVVKSGDSPSNPWVIQPDCAGGPHYELPGDTNQDFWAFKIFADWMYSEQPKRLKATRDVKVALKAYMLALTYEAYPLQNALVDRFREHYSGHAIDFRDLTFLIDRVEGVKPRHVASAALTSYMIEQVAHEICVNGYDKFEEKNWSFKYFINEGDRRHRSDLVRAISCFACKSRRDDPATGSYNWHVGTEGEMAGVLKMA